MRIFRIKLLLSSFIVAAAFCTTSCDKTTQKTQTKIDSESKSEHYDDLLTGNERSPEMAFVKIPAGEFIFGSPEDTPCRAPVAETQFKVRLTHSFVIAESEITQSQWEALDFPNPSREPGTDKPVTFVNFFEALAWCNKLSALESLEPCYNLSSCYGKVGEGYPDDLPQSDEYSSWNAEFNFNCSGNVHQYTDYYACPGYRLPTSAEWEYAAKANTQTHTYGGDIHYVPTGDCEEQPSLENIAWYCNNSKNNIHAVKQKKANPWRLYDILANVYEWTDYYFIGSSISEKAPGSLITDPTGSETGDYVDIRGGSFRECCFVRPSRPFSVHAFARRFDTGFRPVRTVFEDSADADSGSQDNSE